MGDNEVWHRIEKVYQYVLNNYPQYLKILEQFCSIPSVSTQGAGCGDAAAFVEVLLRKLGMECKVIEYQGGNPIILGNLLIDPKLPTLLFYNHYDVQPPDPLSDWHFPPFALTREGNVLFGRGVCDNKGHIISRLLAIAAFQHAEKRLPVNVKWVIEGEEEIGSSSFRRFVEEHPLDCVADGCIWECGYKDAQERIIISFGQKGMVYVELEVVSSRATDLHSGYAATLRNPAWDLVHALASLRSPQGRVAISGFYDTVKRVTIPRLLNGQEKGLTPTIAVANLSAEDAELFFAPTFNISGLEAGYTGEGVKTILPRRAKAKLDMRLVPNQQPEDIVSKLRSHLFTHGYKNIVVKELIAFPAAMTPLDAPFSLCVLEAVWRTRQGHVTIQPIMPGSGVMYLTTSILKIPTVSLGIGFVNSRPHGPNECIRITDFMAGTKDIVAIIAAVGSQNFKNNVQSLAQI